MLKEETLPFFIGRHESEVERDLIRLVGFDSSYRRLSHPYVRLHFFQLWEEVCYQCLAHLSLALQFFEWLMSLANEVDGLSCS